MSLFPVDDSFGVRRKVCFTIIAVVLANISAWAWAWAEFKGSPMLLGTAFIAYLFGLKHAFDADHIAAIDNVVRKLMQEGTEAHMSGLFFSLGHSSVVLLAATGIGFAASALQGWLDPIHQVGAMIGTSVSAIFLLSMGLVNVFTFRETWRMFERVRLRQDVLSADLSSALASPGFFARLFRRLFGFVSRTWHMYPIGFLFGLGFDTATEVGILGISASQAAHQSSLVTAFIFPLLFTAGMCLMDTLDSVMMTGVYGWAFVHPIRKLWYNLTITGASVLIAVFVAGIETLSLVGEELGFRGAWWSKISDLNENLAFFGYAIVGISLLCWTLSAIIYRSKRYDEFAVS